MKLIPILIIAFCAHAFGQMAYVPHARTLKPDGKEYDFGAEYFQVQSVVDRKGQALKLAEGASYQRLDLNFVGKFGFTEGFEGHVGLNARNVVASDVTGSGASEQTFNFNRSGIESAMLGFKYGWKEDDGVKFAAEGWYRKAMFENKAYDDSFNPTEISMGEDTREIAIGLNFYIRTESDNFLSGRVIYRDPAQGLSSEIFSEFEGVIAWQYFAVALGIENVYSMESDAYTADPENKPLTYHGPSQYFNSVNRSWSAPYVKTHIALGDQWRIEGRYTQVMTGNSTDIGPRLSLHLVKRMETSKDFKRVDSQFKEYTIEGSVSKVSKGRSACIIDKGLAAGVKKDMRIDFYHFDYVDGNQLIAKGVVVKTGASKSMVKLTKRYSKKRVEEGTVFRAGIINPN